MHMQFTASSPLALGGANFFPKIRLEGGSLDKIWILGRGGPPNLGTPTAFRREGGEAGKKGWNLGGRCATVYAHCDLLFKVLLIAVDGL